MYIVEKLETTIGYNGGSDFIPVIAGIFKSESEALQLKQLLQDEYRMRIRKVVSDIC